MLNNHQIDYYGYQKYFWSPFSQNQSPKRSAPKQSKPKQSLPQRLAPKQSSQKQPTYVNSFHNQQSFPSQVDMSTKAYSIPNYKRNPQFDYLKVLTWNVNIEAHSAYATKEWIESNNKWDLVYQQCQTQNPDIISFQEIPLPFDNNTSHESHSRYSQIHPLIQKYIDTNKWYITSSRRSHCGHTINLVHKRLEKRGFKIDVSDGIDLGNKWPGFILYKQQQQQNRAECKMNDDSSRSYGKKLLFFGTHLYYGQNNAKRRERSIDRLYQVAKRHKMTEYLVICGDTNMRDHEEVNIVNSYNDISSCWDIVPQQYKQNSMFTCYKNYFKKGKPGVSRYDKLFYGNKVKCIALGIFDHHYNNNKCHYLSDHRGVVAILEIQ